MQDTIVLVDPWDNVTESSRVDLMIELQKELNIGHILYGKDFHIIGRRYDRDDILLRLNNEVYEYAIVHLSWSSKPELKNFPLTWIYHSRVELEKELMSEYYNNHINIITCCHLQELEKYLRSKKYPIEFEGIWWSEQNDSIYFDVFLDKEKLEKKISFDECVKYYEYDGRVAGQEAGFRCVKCNCNIAGNHKLYSKKKIVAQ